MKGLSRIGAIVLGPFVLAACGGGDGDDSLCGDRAANDVQVPVDLVGAGQVGLVEGDYAGHI